MMKKVLFTILAGCAIITFAQVGFGQGQKIENDAEIPDTIAVEVPEKMATVSAIDYENGTGTLSFPDGTTETFIAAPQVRNPDQIKVGNQVILRATRNR